MSCWDSWRHESEGRDAARWGSRYDQEHNDRERNARDDRDSCDAAYMRGYEREIRHREEEREQEAAQERAAQRRAQERAYEAQQEADYYAQQQPEQVPPPDEADARPHPGTVAREAGE